MAYIICEPCIGTKDTACVDACPVDCIHPKKDEPDFEAAPMLYIHLCRFLNFAVTESENIVQLDVTGQPEAFAIIEDLFG